MRPLRIAIALAALSLTASAVPRTYTFSGVTFTDGGTISGTFVFDADAGTPCSSAASPCGVYSSISVVTTNGGLRTGATYTAVCGTNVPGCTGVAPDSTAVLLLTSTAANQTGLPALGLFFTAGGGVPPAGLSDTSGAISINNTTAGAAQEAACSNAGCAAPSAPARATNAGFVIPFVATVPAVSRWGLAALAMMLATLGAWRMRKAAGYFAVLFALALCTTMIAASQTGPKSPGAPRKAPQSQPKKTADTKGEAKEQRTQPRASQPNPWRPPHQ